MERYFEVIHVRTSLMDKPEVQALLAAYPDAIRRDFVNTSEVVVPGDSMAEKITNGKRVLVIDRRSSSLIDAFVNHDPGSVCPSFPKLVPSTDCPFQCEYCFLQSTYRACRPFVCAYVIDLEKLERDLRRKFPGNGRPVMVNAGEMSDPLACDVLEYMRRIVQLFSGLDDVNLIVLTKTGLEEVRPLLCIKHQGHTVAAWSINCDEMVEAYEHGTAPLGDRLAAARAAQDAGYEVRFRLDPMLIFDGWQEAYALTIADVYANCIQPSRFTLGSFRLLGNIKGLIARCFPDSELLEQPLEKERGKRLRHPHRIREQLYRRAIECIRRHDSDVSIALCKETPEMHHRLKGLVDPRRCNCLA